MTARSSSFIVHSLTRPQPSLAHVGDSCLGTSQVQSINSPFHAIGISGRFPFHQNFRAEVRKFLGVEWNAKGPDSLVPFHSQNEFRAHWNGGNWITVARTRATCRFRRWYRWYCVSCFKCILFWAVRAQRFAAWAQTPLSNDEKNIPNSLGK